MRGRARFGAWLLVPLQTDAWPRALWSLGAGAVAGCFCTALLQGVHGRVLWRDVYGRVLPRLMCVAMWALAFGCWRQWRGAGCCCSQILMAVWGFEPAYLRRCYVVADKLSFAIARFGAWMLAPLPGAASCRFGGRWCHCRALPEVYGRLRFGAWMLVFMALCPLEPARWCRCTSARCQRQRALLGLFDSPPQNNQTTSTLLLLLLVVLVLLLLVVDTPHPGTCGQWAGRVRRRRGWKPGSQSMH